jgi:hypothetical protein
MVYLYKKEKEEKQTHADHMVKFSMLLSINKMMQYRNTFVNDTLLDKFHCNFIA